MSATASPPLISPVPGRIWRLWQWASSAVLAAQTALASPPRSGSGGASTPPFAIDLETVDADSLIAEHADAAFRVALSITRDRHLAQDVTQDALLRAWQKLPDFRGDSPLRNWILRITHNTAISTLRRRKDEVRDPDMLPEKETGISVDRKVSGRLMLDEFEVALNELDELSCSIIVLREIEGLSYDEISEMLEVPLPTVRTRLLRARRSLAVKLADWKP